ncbi:MAG: D-alanine--D-alanine ligase [candidate division KSB1 bacterium]|nr:D-alanine--D-alanine ligase [candidate division KSB1 bacterium]MDZ7275122.1 D-alanine--D-alanine ligase [candidate division KSB1 bacterium]MDZ7286430.1 D-alanine--D-alanine ligase [candidate division KSB1 bacterium]MDZ7299406.1 D-alanine--D-alanine ligase [candidate division KSB1 bacterium]MDZ7307815.1 D-alanine--D-alanine ligase [candidate division KSB1 bacterium]
MKKLRVAVLFGGRSGEHEVSLVSATSIIAALDRQKYDVVPVGITKSGRWINGSEALSFLKSGRDTGHSHAIVVPDPNEHRLFPLAPVDLHELASEAGIDVVFPVLHGPLGEDGTVQGLLELANLPYVGSGVLGSAVCMDKVVQKVLCRQAGIPVVDFLWLRTEDWHGDRFEHFPLWGHPQRLSGKSRVEILQTVEETLGLPAFIKPANMGSSVGISLARTAEQVAAGIEEAARYDHKILIEAAVINPREIEVSVLGNLRPRASVCGEVVPSNEFYDYDAKYVDGASQLYIPADLPPLLAQKIRECALQGFLACECQGMARVDFLLERDADTFYLNEINTIPGFTQISMYPKLWEASGLPYPALLDELIQLALTRHHDKNKLLTSYQPKQEWFK